MNVVSVHFRSLLIDQIDCVRNKAEKPDKSFPRQASEPSIDELFSVHPYHSKDENDIRRKQFSERRFRIHSFATKCQGKNVAKQKNLKTK